MLKRRYRSSEENEKLRRLEYFNHPFEPGNEIRLLDDVTLDKPLSLESLSTQFEAVDDKRGKENAIKRGFKEDEKKKKKKYVEDEMEDFEPFDFNRSTY